MNPLQFLVAVLAFWIGLEILMPIGVGVIMAIWFHEEDEDVGS